MKRASVPFALCVLFALSLFGCATNRARQEAGTASASSAVSHALKADSSSTRRAARYVWLEQNTTDVAPWIAPALERYLAVGFTPIITTSPGVDYLSVYEALPEYVVAGFKLCNALPTNIDDDAGWKRINEGIVAYVTLRQQRIRELGGDPSGAQFTLVLECETLLQQHYWRSGDPGTVCNILARRLKALPYSGKCDNCGTGFQPVAYVFYPAFGNDLGIPGWQPRLSSLLKTVHSAIPTARFTDNEFAYTAPNPTWSSGAGLLRTALYKSWFPDSLTPSLPRSLSLLYTDTFTRAHGFTGWSPDAVVLVAESLSTTGRVSIVYPGATEDQFTAPLAFLE